MTRIPVEIAVGAGPSNEAYWPVRIQFRAAPDKDDVDAWTVMMAERGPAEQKQVDLLRGIAGQDRLAFGEFYDQTAVTLFSLAVRMLGDAHEAEEVIQDVFLQIWNKAATFDSAIGQPLHWAMSITRNRCIDRLRSRQRRSQILVETESGEPDRPAEMAPVAADTAARRR